MSLSNPPFYPSFYYPSVTITHARENATPIPQYYDITLPYSNSLPRRRKKKKLVIQMGCFTRRLWIAVSLVLLFFSVLVSAKEKNVLELTSREVEGLLQVCFLADFSGR